MYQVLAGIRPAPAGPGFKRTILIPAVVGDLSWVKARHRSLYGEIVSSWTRDKNKVTMAVTIPPNTTATAYVPAGNAAVVTESGRPAASAPSVKFLRMEDGAAVFAVESGRYRFASERNSQ